MDVFAICLFLLDMIELLQVPENGDFASAGVVEGDEIISVNGITLRLVLFVLKFVCFDVLFVKISLFVFVSL